MEAWSIAPAVLAVVAAATLIAVVGPPFARVADRLADRTGMGEAVAGALLLGAATSTPGLVTTGVGALAGDGGFALSNALGGIAVQTSFIPIADIALRRVNLEHTAASLPNLLQAALLLTLLALVSMATAGPEVAVAGIHPVSAVLVLAYLYGMRVSRQAHRSPMWLPEHTRQTRVDKPEAPPPGERLAALWMRFGFFAAVMAIAGWTLGRAGLSIADETGFTSSEVGTLLTGVVSSLPELVVLLAAVRMGSPTLGVANIIGGNAFDVLMIPAGDALFRGGSLYHAITAETTFVLGLTMALTAVLTAGLLSRQRKGIGFEGLAISALYLIGVVTLLVGI